MHVGIRHLSNGAQIHAVRQKQVVGTKPGFYKLLAFLSKMPHHTHTQIQKFLILFQSSYRRHRNLSIYVSRRIKNAGMKHVKMLTLIMPKKEKNVTVSHGTSLGINKDEPANHKTNKQRKTPLRFSAEINKS